MLAREIDLNANKATIYIHMADTLLFHRVLSMLGRCICFTYFIGYERSTLRGWCYIRVYKSEEASAHTRTLRRFLPEKAAEVSWKEQKAFEIAEVLNILIPIAQKVQEAFEIICIRRDLRAIKIKYGNVSAFAPRPPKSLSIATCKRKISIIRVTNRHVICVRINFTHVKLHICNNRNNYHNV